MRVKLSLRSKFYALMIPSAILLVGLMLLLIVPQNEIGSNVTQINQGLGEVLNAEGFARHYERQLRECAAFIATGSAEHEHLYEQARRDAEIDMAGWIKAEKAHTSDPPAEHARELDELAAASVSYDEVTKACEWAIEVGRSGQPLAAMNYLEEAMEGETGAALDDSINDQLPEEEAQLNRYLDNLDGAVQSLVILRIIGMEDTVASMRQHVAHTVHAESFTRYFNQQVKESLSYLVTGDPEDLLAVQEAQAQAAEALDTWGEQLEQLNDGAPTGKSTPLVDRLDSQYGAFNETWLKSAALARAGDTATAISYVESETGPAAQSSLTTAINKEVEAQKKSLTEDADYISSTSTNAGWGVGLVGALLVLLALGGTFMVSRMVLVPVVQLRNAAQQFGEGGSDVAVEVKSKDELGELATTFNEMAAARAAAETELREARDELEDRVEERTKELERLNEELVGINKELNDFAYVISHDLKAPLRGIGSLASWLATDYDDVLDSQGKEQLHLLLDRAKKMESLIESVLQYSRIGRVRESMERVDLNELVGTAITMINPPANISVTILGKLPTVECEKTRVQQVFQNLIGNAIKFIDEPVGIVTISCRDLGNFWEFAIADNGPGIDSRYFEQIFQIFQTLAPPDDKESTGIGLTLVKKIVEMHGGTVRVESEIDTGSTFFFTLPKI
ncbi:MAG: sensor histidine kinase [Candidatus Geothermincolia bacterium]